MHRCLFILDVLGIIFNEIFEDSESGPETMAALARTCQDFQDTALDILWKEVPDLVPLLKCLPSDAWKITSVNDTPTFQLVRILLSCPHFSSLHYISLVSPNHPFGLV